MAGGMTPGQGRETLAGRIANTRAREAARAAAPDLGHSTADFRSRRPADWPDALKAIDSTPEPEPPEVSPSRHCWYDGPHGRQSALLLRWRRIEDGYDGLIAVAVPDEPDRWAIIEMWVESGMLSPA